MDFTVLQAIYKNDSPDFFDESLNSLYVQELKPKSIVLVRDGEITDKLESVIEKWKNKLPLNVVGYTENKGLAHALNYGMNYIETELTARMDSDDICYPERFKRQIECFEMNQDWEICGTGITEFYIKKNNSQVKRNRFYHEYVDNKSESLFKGTPLGHPTLMIKTNLLKEFRYSENTVMNEDIDLWFRLLRNNHIIHNIQEPLLYFRITDDTFKRRRIEKARNEYDIYKKNLLGMFKFNIKFIFPFARFVSRLMPKSIIKKMYVSDLRNRFLSK